MLNVLRGGVCHKSLPKAIAKPLVINTNQFWCKFICGDGLPLRREYSVFIGDKSRVGASARCNLPSVSWLRYKSVRTDLSLSAAAVQS